VPDGSIRYAQCRIEHFSGLPNRPALRGPPRHPGSKQTLPEHNNNTMVFGENWGSPECDAHMARMHTGRS